MRLVWRLCLPSSTLLLHHKLIWVVNENSREGADKAYAPLWHPSVSTPLREQVTLATHASQREVA